MTPLRLFAVRVCPDVGGSSCESSGGVIGRPGAWVPAARESRRRGALVGPAGRTDEAEDDVVMVVFWQ
jgi:hypothetical protein